MNNVMNILGEILGLAILALIAVVLPKIRAYFVAKFGEEKTEAMIEQIKWLVAAAEQMYKERDPDGKLRKDFVKTQLEALGVKITPDVDAIIEGCVYELNQARKPEDDF